MSVAFRLVAVITLLVGLAAIPARSASAGVVISVSMTDSAPVGFAVTPGQTTAVEGPITFEVSNDGALPHNFLVIATDLPPGGLPLTPDGQFADEAPLTVVGSTPEYLPGEVRTLTVDLSPGNYVLICNNAAGHYPAGMSVGFVVTAATAPPTYTPPTDGGSTPPPTDGEPTDAPSDGGAAGTPGQVAGPIAGYGPTEGSSGFSWLLPLLAAAGAGLAGAGAIIGRLIR